MFKVSYVSTVDGLKEAQSIMDRIYQENPKHWPYGLTAGHFDGGVYLVREKRSNTPIGFVGWQERTKAKALRLSTLKEAGSPKIPYFDNFAKAMGVRMEKVGYYSVGILKEFRRNHFAKEALSKLIAIKSAGVDRVQALIVSDNAPSLALADSLGVEKQVKKANTAEIAGLLKAMTRSPVAEGIFGPVVKSMAQKGVHFTGPESLGGSLVPPLGYAKTKNPYSLLHSLLSHFKQYPKYETSGLPLSAKGVVIAPTGVDSVEGLGHAGLKEIPTKIPPWDSDKLMEAKALQGFIPPSVGISELKGTPAQRLEAIQKRLGGQFILKPRGGRASAAGSFLTERSDPKNLLAAMRDSDLMAQERRELQPLPAWQKRLDKTIQNYVPSTATTNRGTREFRVMAVGGKAIPYGTMQRGSTTGTLSFLLPFRTAKMRQSEALVQQALDKLPPEIRNKGVFNFDVGIDHTGKPFIIEANPSDLAGAGSFLTYPPPMDAMGAAIQGKLPLYVKGRRLAAGATALGAGGLGYHELKGQQQESPMAQYLAKLKQQLVPRYT